MIWSVCLGIKSNQNVVKSSSCHFTVASRTEEKLLFIIISTILRHNTHMHYCIFPFLFISSYTFHSCPLLLKLHDSIQTCSHTMGTHYVKVCNWSLCDTCPPCRLLNSVVLHCPGLFLQPQQTNLIQPEDQRQIEKMNLHTVRLHTTPDKLENKSKTNIWIQKCHILAQLCKHRSYFASVQTGTMNSFVDFTRNCVLKI